MEHFSTIRKFFAGDGHQSTQEWIRLQILRRQATPRPDDDNNEVPIRTTRLKTRDVRFHLLYRCTRSVKSWGRSWNSRFPGWRSGIAGFSLLATFVLVANLSALIWAATHLDAGSYYATMTVQYCKSVDHMSSWIHLAMNVLSAALLAGSNYCMQCLSSPTRPEIDAAHAKGSYLNIGILSFRKIISFRKRRICLLLALGLSSVPLHAVYASSVTTMRSNQVWYSTLVSPEFFSGISATSNNKVRGIYDFDTQYYDDRLGFLRNLTFDEQIQNGTRWMNLSAAECQQYKFLEMEHGSLLLVTEDKPELNFKSLSDDNLDSTIYDYHMYHAVLQSPRQDSYISSANISYYLSLNVPRHCSLQIHLWLMLTVVVCNMIKFACFLLTFKEQGGIPLVTVGDAVESFLRSPLSNTKGMCLSSKDGLLAAIKHDMGPRPRQYQPTYVRYYQSISFVHWTIYSISCALLILFSSLLLNQIRARYRDDEHIADSWRTIWNMGFGKLRTGSNGISDAPWCYISAYRYSHSCQSRLRFGNIFVAAVPQLAISAIYLAINHQITVMVQLRDWTRLALRRQPLRVSDPTPGSVQVSTYWLSLPYQYSLPLLGSSILLGWLASQAIFYYRMVYYNDDGSIFTGNSPYYDATNMNPEIYEGVGWSGMGVILSIVVGVCVFLSSLIFGIQKCAPGIPPGPTSSIVIAVACHPPENNWNAATKLVQWGEVQSDIEVGERDPVHHCTITSRKVKSPKRGELYSEQEAEEQYQII